jgi:hypothetical protein
MWRNIVSSAVQQLLDSFDALPEADRHEAAVEILRRVIPSVEGEFPETVLVEVADELFLALDAEEAAHAES